MTTLITTNLVIQSYLKLKQRLRRFELNEKSYNGSKVQIPQSKL